MEVYDLIIIFVWSVCVFCHLFCGSPSKVDRERLRIIAVLMM